MFNFKKKVYKKINDYPDTWDVRQAKLDGNDFFIRICTGLQDAMSHPDYQYQIGIAIPLNWHTETGIVSKVESPALQDIEDLLGEKLESEDTRLVAVLTGENMREFVFYTSAPESAENRIKEIEKEVSSHKIQYIIQKDSEWNTYKFING